MATFELKQFTDNPSVAYLRSCKVKKDDWVNIASHYEITFTKGWRKSQIKNAVLNALVRAEVLGEEAFDLCDDDASPLALKQVELRYALGREERERKERLAKEERERKEGLEKEERERKERLEKEERERKERLEEKEKDRQFQLEMARVTSNSGRVVDNGPNNQFHDVTKMTKTLPNFDENEPDEFFYAI